jgi:hypothetical protein
MKTEYFINSFPSGYSLAKPGWLSPQRNLFLPYYEKKGGEIPFCRVPTDKENQGKSVKIV